MSQKEVYNRLYADMQKAKQENMELRKQIIKQNKDYERVVKRYQQLQYAHYMLQQHVAELNALYNELTYYHKRFASYLDKLSGGDQ